MARTEVDQELVQRAKRIYGLRTTREVIDLALRRLVGDVSSDPHAGLLELRGMGWDGDLETLRRHDPGLESQLSGGLPVLALRGITYYEWAAELYRRVRHSSVTPRQLTDVLIMLCTLDVGATLLHADRDFDHLAAAVA